MSTICVIQSTGSYTPVRGRAPGRIQSLRAFRRSAPRLSVVGRCLDFKAVGLFGELLYCPGHQLTSEAHRRWSHRGTAKSHRSGAICCRCACSWVRPLVPKSMFIRAGGHADKQPLDRVRGIWEIPPKRGDLLSWCMVLGCSR